MSALAASVRDCGGHLTWTEGGEIIWPKVPGCRCLVPVRERDDRARALLARIEALDDAGRYVVLRALLREVDGNGLERIEGTVSRAEAR